MTAPESAASRAFMLAPGEGRTPAPLNIVGESTMVKVSAGDTAGALALFHLTAPRFTGPPLHVHTREDELFYVLDGTLVFEIGGLRSTVHAGGVVYLPRGVPHRYQNFEERDATLLIAVTPGESFEAFFTELAAATPPAGGVPPLDILRAIDSRYGLETLGPPMFE